ncbi:MAG: YlxM family DNA-binding protein [Bacillota bacterium]
MEKFAWVNLLYDFYGQLLTEHQRKFVELYYGQDLSLSEIAEHYRLSRQAIHDVLKRAESSLFKYEEKLGLVNRFLEQRKRLNQALEILGGEQGDKIFRVRKIINEAMELF